MGEVLILIIIALVWGFKAAVANEDKKVNDRETGSVSASPDELIKKATRTAEDLDALRGQTEKKRPSPTEIKALHKQHRADEWERNGHSGPRGIRPARRARQEGARAEQRVSKIKGSEYTMYDELTQVDIDKMKAELEHRRLELRPKLIEDVQTARAFGDLSENYEYKVAKQEKNRNESRIRYLERMIATAKVIEVNEKEGTVGLFDHVALYNEKLGKEQNIQLVTTLRQNALKGLISKESPVGKAILGKKVGDRVEIVVSPEMKYTVEIRSITPGEDDASLEISSY